MSTSENSTHVLKPILGEIVRTQVCFPNIKLTVENVVIVSVGEATFNGKNEAFRLFLTDGEKTIQAVVRRRMHRAVLELSIRRGSILVLTGYHIATGKRLSGEGDISYLAISDFYVAAYDERYDFISMQHRSKSNNAHNHKPGLVPQAMPVPKSDKKAEHNPEHPSEKTSLDFKHVDHQSEAFPIPRNDAWIRKATHEHHQRCHMAIDTPQAQRNPSEDDVQHLTDAQSSLDVGPNCVSVSYMALQAMMAGTPLQPIRKPLKILELASVTGANKSRNQTVDVLAVIDSIDDFTIKPARLPLKRDIRLIDRSVSEPVTLSIFVDPVNFRSTVGTVALFRNVTTHDYRRGNVNAYPVHCAGKEWFVPNPRCINLGDVDLDEWEQWYEMKRSQQLMGSDMDDQ